MTARATVPSAYAAATRAGRSTDCTAKAENEVTKVLARDPENAEARKLKQLLEK